MGMKFNPFTGKLDIVGMSEERFAELSEKESTIEEGLVFRTWGGLKAPYDFSAEGKAMTVKKTLETIILEKVNATIEGKGGFDEFVNVPHICSPVFTITRKSYPITQIVVKHYNASNQLIDTLTLNKNTKSYIENNTNLDINSVVIKNGNTPVSVDNLFDTDGNLAYSSLTIAMPSLSVQAYNKWTGTITENTTDPEKDELPTSNDVTASVEAKFHYPKAYVLCKPEAKGYSNWRFRYNIGEKQLYITPDADVNNLINNPASPSRDAMLISTKFEKQTIGFNNSNSTLLIFSRTPVKSVKNSSTGKPIDMLSMEANVRIFLAQNANASEAEISDYSQSGWYITYNFDPCYAAVEYTIEF